MITLTLATVAMGGAIGLLIKIAVICVVIWAIKALLEWAGIAIPRPVWIIGIAIVCIILIYWASDLIQMLLS